MLDPRYLEHLPEEILKIYSRAELEILRQMARRLSKYDYWIPAVEHQRRMLEQAGVVRDDILAALSGLTRKSTQEISKMMTDAVRASMAADAKAYMLAGLEAPDIRQSKPIQALIQQGVRNLQGELKNICRSTAQTASQQFESVLNDAWMQISTGAIDYGAAIRAACKRLVQSGIHSVRYPSGRTDSIEVAVRRAAVTGVNQTALQVTMQSMNDLGVDLVEVSAHAGARPSHAAWQGRIYSLSGNHTKYQDFRTATGYGTGAGLGGWNCRHSFGPYIEGSQRVWSTDALAELEKPKYEYGGRQLTEYEASQIQRYNERQIRRWKREYAALDAAGEDTSAASMKIHRLEAVQSDFINSTGLRRQYERENTTNFNPADAARVDKEAQKIAETLEKKEKYGIIVSELKATGAIPQNAAVKIPALSIDAGAFSFDDAHINVERKHGVTRENAEQWIKRAKVSVTVWKGQFERFYSEQGACYVDMRRKMIRTAFRAEQYDQKTVAFMEVLKKNGL